MNVALVIDGLGAGGAENVVRQLACGLVARGHRASVYCLKNAGAPAEELRKSGVRVREANSTAFDPSLSWRLGTWMRTDQIDVVHTHNSASLVHSLMPTRLLRIALVQTRHGALLGQPTRHRRMADALARFAERVTIVSETLRKDLPPVIAAASLHVPNGVDRELVSRDEARRELEQLCRAPFDGPVVLSVGTISAEKDTLGLLQAFVKLRQARADVSLVCIGGARDKSYLARVEALRRREGLADCVHLIGEVDHAWRFMAGVEVFCLSSRTEAAPMVVLEAMSQRVPIVATAVGDVGSLEGTHGMIQHGQSGLLVAPGEAGALANAIQSVLEDADAAQQRSEAAAADYENHYTAEQMTRGYERVYLSCRRDAPSTLRRGARRPRILMVGPAPPTIGGMVSVIDALMTGSARDRFVLVRFPTCGQRRREGEVGLIRSVNRHMAGLSSLGRAIVVNRINLLHIHTCSKFSFYRSLADLLLGKLFGRRVILHIHGGQFDRFCQDSGWIGRSAIRRGCELADAVVVLSQNWRDSLSPFTGCARLEVVPNGVNIPRSRGRRGSPTGALQAETVPCRFIFVGALTRRKGMRELLEAAVWLRDRGSRFELFIAGPCCENEPDWAEHVRLVGLESEVTLVGPVAGPGKKALFDSADCLVLPSHVEGLPIVVLEAAARGLPVIATDVGGTAELLTMVAADGATREISPLVPAGDAAALGEAMARLLDDAPLRREMGAALRDHVSRNFSLAAQTSKLTRLYQSLLPECASRAVSTATKISDVVRPPTDHAVEHTREPRQKTPQATVCP